MVFLLLALFATMTSARNLQQHQDDDQSLDEAQFSLRDLATMMFHKRGAREECFAKCQKITQALQQVACLQACNLEATAADPNRETILDYWKELSGSSQREPGLLELGKK